MVSRSGIVEATGLSDRVVATLAGELVEMGLLAVTTGPRNSRPPGAEYRLDDSYWVGLGVEIGTGHLSVVATDLVGAVRFRKKTLADNRRDSEAVIDDIARLVCRAFDSLQGEGLRVGGVTVALPGLVGRSSGVVIEAPGLGWSGVAAGAMLSRNLESRGRCPAFDVRIENAANCGAVAELWEGAGRDLSDFLFLASGEAVRAGLVSDGSLFRGAEGFGGEIGHVVVDPSGPLCRCGSRGCLDALVSDGALLRRFEGCLEAGGFRVMDHRVVERVVHLAVDNDERTVKVLGSIGTDIGVALAAALNVLGPQAVVLGGVFAGLTPWMDEAISDELGCRVMAARRTMLPVHGAHWPWDGAARGAAVSVVRRIMDDPGVVSSIEGRG